MVLEAWDLLPTRRPGTRARRRPRHRTRRIVRPSSGRSTTRPTDVTRRTPASHQWVFDGHAGGWSHATWSPGSLNVSAPPPVARPATATPQVPFCDVSAWLLRETAPSPPRPRPWDQAWDDPNPDEWTTEAACPLVTLYLVSPSSLSRSLTSSPRFSSPNN